MKQKDFKNWNSLKEQLHNDKINFRYRERDIFFMYLGANIGFAILSQLRLFDIKRAKFRDGQISKENFFDLQNELLRLIVTPHFGIYEGKLWA